MLDFAIRKSETAIGRAAFMLVLAAIAVLGLVWLSIAAAGWLLLVVSPPAAAAITGVTFIGISAVAYFVSRTERTASDAKSEALAGNDLKTEDMISRATRIAERMAPDAPMAALSFALLAGLASVSLPAALNPFLNKILDDVDKTSEVRIDN